MIAKEEVRIWPGTPGPALKAGAAAGVLGGVAMSLWAVGRAVLAGLDWTTPLQLLGAPLIGRIPFGPPGTLLVSGAVLHLGVAMILGMVFALLLPFTRSPGLTLLLAVGYALLVMVVMTAVVLPVTNPVLRAQVGAMAGSWLVEHLLFGASLALVPALRTRFSDPV